MNEKLYIVKAPNGCDCASGDADGFLHRDGALVHCLEKGIAPAEVIHAKWAESCGLEEASNGWRLTMIQIDGTTEARVFFHGNEAERRYYHSLDEQTKTKAIPYFPRLRDGRQAADQAEAVQDVGEELFDG
jgi:hypothetical protein